MSYIGSFFVILLLNYVHDYLSAFFPLPNVTSPDIMHIVYSILSCFSYSFYAFYIVPMRSEHKGNVGLRDVQSNIFYLPRKYSWAYSSFCVISLK